MQALRTMWDKPNWRLYLLLPVLHFLAIEISFYCGKTAENEVIIWLPNALLLTALLHFNGQRAWLFAGLTFVTNVIGNLPTAPLSQAILLSSVNLFEVSATFLLMRYVRASARLAEIQDFIKFVVAGPLVCCFLSGILGALVIDAYHPESAFFTVMRVWWFDDGLGMLIFTPLLLRSLQGGEERIHWRYSDALILLFTVGLTILMFLDLQIEGGHVPLTPTLLIPPMLGLAVRFGVRITALGVALISLAVSRMVAIGIKPFGEMTFHQSIIHTQEFILTFSIICMGAAILRQQLKSNERTLESKVLARTDDLSRSLMQLKQTQADLVQSEKLASLGSLVAGVAHELNTPIGNAVTCVSVLAHRVDAMKELLATNEMRRSALDDFFNESKQITVLIEKSVRRAVELIENFKQIAVDRTSENQRQFQLLKLVTDIAYIWRLNHKTNVWDIDIQIVPHIECDGLPGALGQIINNLIQNAALHAFDAPLHDGRKGVLTIRAYEKQDMIELLFHDNGKGMSADTCARIFDPFFTTRFGQGGSGLGLSICRNIAVGIFGGSLSVTSEENVGTTFILRFTKKWIGPTNANVYQDLV